MSGIRRGLAHKLHTTWVRRRYDFRHRESSEVVIASAVRTPITGFHGHYPPLSAVQLGAVAIDAALKQAAVPLDAIRQVYFGNVLETRPGQAPARQATILAGLPKRVSCTTVSAASVTGIKTIMFAAQAVKLGITKAAVAGGMECVSNIPRPNTHSDLQIRDGILTDGVTEKPSVDVLKTFGITKEQRIEYTKESYMRMRRAYRAGLFDPEIVPLRIAKKEQRAIMVTEDEQRPISNSLSDMEGPQKNQMVATLGDGAAALVLTTTEMAQRWKLTPLARIIGYHEAKLDNDDFVTAPAIVVKNLLEKTPYTIDDISLWELDDSFSAVPLAVIKKLELNPARVNAHGGAMCLGHPIAMSGARMVTHLAHALQPNEIGCAAITNGSGNAAALLIEKMGPLRSTTWSDLPLLTLYTKDYCMLCDNLVNELQNSFTGQFRLEKIDITRKENRRFLRLYRNDVPVIFLNGQFLCMHKLNANLLSRRLEQLRQNP